MSTYEALVETTRGGIVESVHLGALVLVDTRGERRWSIGDPELVSFPRSSLKPFQFLTFVAQGGIERFGLGTQEIAIAVASHAGEEIHINAVRSLLEKIDAPEVALLCGVQAPGDVGAAERLGQRGQKPSAIHNNCSGKHAGMLALARLLGAPLEGYIDPQHPVQTAIRECLIDALQLDAGNLPLGIDGCSAPAYGVPLAKLARGFALLGRPSDAPDPWRAGLERISSAMRLHPELVAGTSMRVDTDLMRASNGAVTAKGGAEGYFGMGHRDGVGLAFKISDGDGAQRARRVAVVACAERLGWIAPGALAQHGPCVAIHNWAGRHTGDVRPASIQNWTGALDGS